METVKKITFKNGDEMLRSLNSHDLYNKETGEYVFSYNDVGSVAVYTLSPSEAKELYEKTRDTDVSWSELLGPGGYIYDDPSYPGKSAYSISNEEWCDDHFKGTWRIVHSWA